MTRRRLPGLNSISKRNLEPSWYASRARPFDTVVRAAVAAKTNERLLICFWGEEASAPLLSDRCC